MTCRFRKHHPDSTRRMNSMNMTILRVSRSLFWNRNHGSHFYQTNCIFCFLGDNWSKCDTYLHLVLAGSRRSNTLYRHFFVCGFFEVSNQYSKSTKICQSPTLKLFLGHFSQPISGAKKSVSGFTLIQIEHSIPFEQVLLIEWGLEDRFSLKIYIKSVLWPWILYNHSSTEFTLSRPFYMAI